MVKASSGGIVEIEVDSANPRNGRLFFKPLSRTLRGRYAFQRNANIQTLLQAKRWPVDDVPGQRLRLDLSTGCASIIEPLQGDDQRLMKAAIEKRGLRLPEAEENIGPVDVATYLHWMRRAVESGHARLVQGEFPAELPGEPKREFYTSHIPDPRDKLISKLIDVVAGLLPPEKRAELARSLAEV